jgi:hypothetical protein
MFLSDNCTENTHLLHEETITLEIITDVREMDPNGDIEAFCYFFDHLVPCVAGQKVWTQREKANKLISEAKKVVSVLDEALTVLALKNYWKRWNNTGTAINVQLIQIRPPNRKCPHFIPKNNLHLIENLPLEFASISSEAK